MDEKRKDLNKKIYRLTEIRGCIESLLVEAEGLVYDLSEDEEGSHLANTLEPLAKGIQLTLARIVYKVNKESKKQEIDSNMKEALDEYGKVLSTGCKPNASSIASTYGVDFEDFAVEIENLDELKYRSGVFCSSCGSSMVEYAEHIFGCANSDCLNVKFDPMK